MSKTSYDIAHIKAALWHLNSKFHQHSRPPSTSVLNKWLFWMLRGQVSATYWSKRKVALTSGSKGCCWRDRTLPLGRWCPLLDWNTLGTALPLKGLHYCLCSHHVIHFIYVVTAYIWFQGIWMTWVYIAFTSRGKGGSPFKCHWAVPVMQANERTRTLSGKWATTNWLSLISKAFVCLKSLK